MNHPSSDQHRANDDRRSPFKEWLLSLKWDGVARLETFFPRYCGSPDSPFVREAGRKWLTGAVWRTCEPGCPVHYMLITQGGQGIGKSTLPKILWGAENVISVLSSEMQHKDNLSLFHSGKVTSLEEFDGLSFKDVGRLKGIITNERDTYRAPYKSAPETFARSSVMYASTNKFKFLKHDASGQRRFVVVPVVQLDFAALIRDREQLWAEAVALYGQLTKAGTPYELSNVRGATEQAAQYEDSEDHTAAFDEAMVRRLAHEACRLIPDGPGCVMDERPYRGDCTYKNCGTMCALRDMLLRLSLCDTQSSEPKS